MHCIEKIAALDAADLKLKPRKGSTYPIRAENKAAAAIADSKQSYM